MDIIFVLWLLGPLVIGYLSGSIQNGIMIGKIFFKKDVRDYGSHNAGGTNVGRVFGKKIGLLCIILDIIKTFAPMIIFFFVYRYYVKPMYEEISYYNFIDEYAYSLAAFGATLGHCYPCFYSFKGGKAVSAFGGICLFTSWLNAAVGFSIFLIVLKLKKYVSLASMIGSSCVAISSIIMIFTHFGTNFNIHNYILYAVLMSVLALILIIRHRANIIRLIRKEESKIKWM